MIKDYLGIWEIEHIDYCNIYKTEMFDFGK